jgi:hypothetical protein
VPGSLRHRADVSVVVVAHGAEPGLPESVRSLLASLDDAARGAHVGARGAHDAPHADAAGGLRGDHLGGELVLVVRDVAALPCAVRAADPRVRVVAAPGVAGGRARNVGVAAARGRYLLFTVPGVRVPAGWVAALVAPLRSGHADLVAGAVHPPGGAPATGPAAALLGLVADPPPRGVLPEASAGATRAVLEAVGFDEALGTARYPGAAEVFRRDVVGAGFRAHAVAGVPVEVPADPGPGPGPHRRLRRAAPARPATRRGRHRSAPAAGRRRARRRAGGPGPARPAAAGAGRGRPRPEVPGAAARAGPGAAAVGGGRRPRRRRCPARRRAAGPRRARGAAADDAARAARRAARRAAGRASGRAAGPGRRGRGRPRRPRGRAPVLVAGAHPRRGGPRVGRAAADGLSVGGRSYSGTPPRILRIRGHRAVRPRGGRNP